MEAEQITEWSEPRNAQAGERFTWHNGFYEAIRLEFAAYQSALDYEIEYQLTDEPLRIDTVVIKKPKDAVIEKNIGRIFREHNIVEYKSHNESLTFEDFHKVAWEYAGGYAAKNRLSLNAMTVSFVSPRYPEKALARVRDEYGLVAREQEPGVYYITGLLMPAQVIASSRLSERDNVWLRNLNDKLKAADMLAVLEAGARKPAGLSVAAYMHIVFQSNPETLKEVLEMNGLTVEKILEDAGYIPKWRNEGMQYGLKQGLQQGITQGARNVAANLKKMGMPVEQISQATGLSKAVIEQL
jgi:hypothetical protein